MFHHEVKFGPYEDDKLMTVEVDMSEFIYGSLKLKATVRDVRGNEHVTNYELAISPEGDGPCIFLIEDDIPNHYLPLNGVDK